MRSRPPSIAWWDRCAQLKWKTTENHMLLDNYFPDYMYYSIQNLLFLHYFYHRIANFLVLNLYEQFLFCECILFLILFIISILKLLIHLFFFILLCIKIALLLTHITLLNIVFLVFRLSF